MKHAIPVAGECRGTGEQEKGKVGCLAAEQMGRLFDILHEEGYRVFGPTIQGKAIVHEELDGPGDLPVGWTHVEEAGTYRLERRADGGMFGYTVGPEGWKKFLFPRDVRLWDADRVDGRIDVSAPGPDVPKRAFLGVRGCDLQAIAMQDRIFLQSGFVDPHYEAARRDLMLIGVNCTQSGGTCFCDSMGTGPDVGEGADVVLTELMEGDAHTLLVEARTAKGQMIFDKLGVEEASDDARERAKQVIEQTRSQMGRTMDTAGLGAMLRQNLEHPRWHEVAERCLACANCTMVCPTCFCSTVEDVTDLGGGHAERWRRWDSCFSLGFSYISGGRVRTSTRARYRQWLSHKLSSWVDQFGSSGCVGCGRCITWCPVGIDLTDEVAAIRATSAPIATDSRRRPHDHSKP